MDTMCATRNPARFVDVLPVSDEKGDCANANDHDGRLKIADDADGIAD